MVKAGVYLLIRLSPGMHDTMAGILVSLIGGFTFIAASMMAIAQTDAKKVLAFSTVSNLGLIVACAGIGVEETIWAAVLLMIFHAISKSMLFQAVGAVENSIGSRNIERMHGLILRLPKLTYIMGIGIAGMYLAPFGMLISKWVALRSFVDADNVLLVLFLAFGSARCGGMIQVISVIALPCGGTSSGRLSGRLRPHGFRADAGAPGPAASAAVL